MPRKQNSQDLVKCSECKFASKCSKHVATWELDDNGVHYWQSRPVEFCSYGEREYE